MDISTDIGRFPPAGKSLGDVDEWGDVLTVADILRGQVGSAEQEARVRAATGDVAAGLDREGHVVAVMALIHAKGAL